MTTAAGRRPRPWTGALALGGLLAVAVTLVLLVSPAARHEAALSSHRQATPFVALSFADPAAARSCPTTGDAAAVRFDVRSDLEAEAPVAWRVDVSRPDGTTVHTASGSVGTAPGLVSAVATRVAVPRTGRYAVRVSLPGRDETLAVHCGGTS